MFVVPAWLLVSLGLSWFAPAAPQTGARGAPPSALPTDGGRLLREVAPETLEARLAAEPALGEPALTALAAALTAADPETAAAAERYLAACARARSRRLSAAASDAEVDDLVTLLLVHPRRFAEEPAFRARVLRVLPQALDPEAPAALRDRLLTELNQLVGFDYEASERVEAAWGAVPRASAARRLPEAEARALRYDDDLSHPLAASLYSLPSAIFDAAEAERFLAAVRALDPRRELLVLTDLPLASAAPGREPITLLPTYGRPFSPWPRDPLSLVRRADGGLAVLLRPNAQPQREEDLFLGRELVQTLPERLDGAWRRPGWAVAPVPFHNGQVLLTPEAAWITLHALELRALELLGLSRVPAEEFARPPGVDRYMSAVERAAAELAVLYRRPVRFAHPLPGDLPAAGRPALMAKLGGGAGYDLDSLVTLLPARPAAVAARRSGRRTGEAAPPLTALVADLRAGRALVAATPAADWAAFRAGYGLAPAPAELPAALAAALDGPAAVALAEFLDLVAGHLAQAGMRVERLPLLYVPVSLLAEPEGIAHSRFLVTWNNVVVETRDGKVRAEGFGSLLPAADRQVAAVFRDAGARLDLLPPLVRSVVLTGGYRCASNHVRGRGTVLSQRSAEVGAASERVPDFLR
jgi:hypothetical protein